HQSRPARGRRDRRRQPLPALLARDLAAAPAGDDGGRALLRHPDLRRLPAGLCADRRRTGERDASLRHLRLPDRHRHRAALGRRGHLAGDVPGAAARRRLPALVHPQGREPMIEGARWKKWLWFYLPLGAFIIALLFPFYWMIVTTVRPDGELYRPWNSVLCSPFWTSHPTLEHVKDLLQETLFNTWMLNTMFIALASTLISLVCGVIAGYALARLTFRWAGILGTVIFVTYLVPQTLLFIPLAEIIRHYRIGDTPWALILTYPTFLIPFCTWLMMGYFKAIPKELEECARIDGAARWQAMLYIIFPIAVPGILSAAIFAFT